MVTTRRKPAKRSPTPLICFLPEGKTAKRRQAPDEGREIGHCNGALYCPCLSATPESVGEVVEEFLASTFGWDMAGGMPEPKKVAQTLLEASCVIWSMKPHRSPLRAVTFHRDAPAVTCRRRGSSIR